MSHSGHTNVGTGIAYIMVSSNRIDQNRMEVIPMYVSPNFKTKKQLKEAVARYNEYKSYRAAGPMTVGAVMASKFERPPREVRVFSPGQFPPCKDGTEFVEGPHYPESHRWYAGVEVVGGIVVGVK